MKPDPQPFHPELRWFVVITLIGLAVLARLLPHPPNFTPIGALALFGGACCQNRWASLLLPVGSLFLSDLVLGLHVLMPVVYASFLINVLLGRWLRTRRTLVNATAVALIGSLQFFLVTNFACWVLYYPRSWEGLLACYAAAIPFFRNMMAGDFLFTLALFGGLALMERGFPVIREPAPVPTA